MNILLFIDDLGSGGAQRQIVTLSRLFSEKGHSVNVLVYHEADFFAPYLDSLGVNILKAYSQNYLSRVFRIRRVIRSREYDVVVSFLDTPNFINNLCGIGLTSRNWGVITSERSNKVAFHRSIKGRIFSWFQRFSDAIVCNSQNAATMWLRHCPQYRDKLFVFYNAVVLPKIKIDYSPKRAGRTHIVVAASYRSLKNPIGLIKALTLLSKEEQELLRIEWYGQSKISDQDDGVIYRKAQGIIDEYRLNDVIRLYGENPNIISKMASADFVGLFSQLEGLPNAICEGMMLGKPLIMTRVSDYSVLIDDSNGFLCNWDDIGSIAHALRKAIGLSVDEMLAMGDRSLRKGCMLFDPNSVEGEWERLFFKIYRKNKQS